MMKQIFLKIFLHWGLQVLSIVFHQPQCPMVKETNRYGDTKQLSKSGDENMNLRSKKMESHNQGRVPCLFENCS